MLQSRTMSVLVDEVDAEFAVAREARTTAQGCQHRLLSLNLKLIIGN